MSRLTVRLSLIAVLLASSSAFAAPDVGVRASTRDDFTRIVFDWPTTPAYVTEQTSSSLILKFQTAANFKIEGDPPASLPRVASFAAKDGRVVTVGLSPDQKARHFEIGKRVIVDIRGPATEKALSQKEAVKPAVSATEKPVAVQPATPASADKTGKTGFSIELKSARPQGIAVFRRGSYLWIVTDGTAAPGLPKITSVKNDSSTFQRLDLKEATAFYIKLPEHRDFAVTGGGMAWTITAETPQARARDFTRVQNTGKTSVLWPGNGVRRIIDIADPIVGDTIRVAPISDVAQGRGPVREFPQFSSLPAFAGLAIETRADDLDVRAMKGGVEIASKNGLSISASNLTVAVPEEKPEIPLAATTEKPDPPPDQKAPADTDLAAEKKPDAVAEETKAPAAPATGFFHFRDWEMGGATATDENRRVLMGGMSEKDDTRKSADLMKLGKMDLAYALGPEASGYMDLAAEFAPELAQTPEFVALHGAADALSGQFEPALRQFTNDGLKDEKEILYWKAYALSGLEDWAQAAEILPDDPSPLSSYTDTVRVPLALALSEVALRDGNVGKAQGFMALAETKDMALPYRAALDYMRGEALRQQGKTDETETIWKKLQNGRDDLYRAKAGLALTSLQLEKKTLKPADAIDRLEGLRYAWRGDELETSVNYQLGKVYLASNEPLKGLAILKQATLLSPDSEQAKKIRAEMASSFVDQFEPNRIKDINPVDAITLYRDYADLIPKGADGNRLTTRLADRLAAADLLPRAAALLQKQLDSTTAESPDAAATAIRLASIYIENEEPDKAQISLTAADTAMAFAAESDKADLARQIAMLKAQAFSLQKKPDEAFALLADLPQDTELLALRADIAWENQRWQDAADSLEAMAAQNEISTTRPATDDEARLLLNWAVALYLADNRYVLSNLRSTYTTAMAASPKSSQFEVVTRPRSSTLLADRDSINAIIEETDIFKGFVDSARAQDKARDDNATKTPAQSVAPVAATPPKPAPDAGASGQ